MLYAIINSDGTFGGMVSDRAQVTPGADYETRNDWKNFEAAKVIADAASEFHGKPYIATDNGPNFYPRFDVVQVPSIGDEVSYSFNGDTYPDGVVVAVSPTFKKVTTNSGRSYYRRLNTGSWVEGGTWSLVRGHHSERNPHI